MAIFKRGSTWWIDLTTPGGERIRRSAQTKKREEALELHDRLKSEAWRISKLKERPGYTWDEAATRWLKENGHLASIETQKSILRFVSPYLRGLALSDITGVLIRSIGEEKQKECSKATANRHLSLIRNILRRAVEWDWIDSVPAVREYSEPEKRIRWLTRDEVARLIRILPDHTKDVVLFALSTGLRMSNILGLEWSQIDLGRRVAWIHPDQAKAKKAIGVPLSEEAIGVINRQIGKNERFVFTYVGKPIKRVNTHAWEKALKKAGIKDFRFHDLRHTWASWHVQAGTPLHVLQELGGWNSYQMVQRYAHLAPEHLAEYADKISCVTNTTQADLRLMR